jgi:hypothetical protein
MAADSPTIPKHHDRVRRRRHRNSFWDGNIIEESLDLSDFRLFDADRISLAGSTFTSNQRVLWRTIVAV